jgi:hypothetical protein
VRGVKRKGEYDRIAAEHHLLERSFGAFERIIALNYPINTHKAQAILTAGVLKVVFPKVENRRGGAFPIPGQGGVSMAAETKEKKDRDTEVKIPKSLPVLPLRDMVVYPFIISPLSIARESSIKAVDIALSENRMVLLLAQKDKEKNEVAGGDLFKIGTVAVIMRMLKLPTGASASSCRASAAPRWTTTSAEVVPRREIDRIVRALGGLDTIEREALLRGAKKALERSSSLGKTIPSEVMVIANNLEDPGRLGDLIASNLELKVEDAQGILETTDPVDRLKKVSQLLKRELDLLAMQQEIDSLARDEIDKSQREYFLRQQMKAIQHELGEGNELAEEIERIRRKVAESADAGLRGGRGGEAAQAPRADASGRFGDRPRCATTSSGWSTCPGTRRRRTTST